MFVLGAGQYEAGMRNVHQAFANAFPSEARRVPLLRLNLSGHLLQHQHQHRGGGPFTRLL